jgi:hypothetical protein
MYVQMWLNIPLPYDWRMYVQNKIYLPDDNVTIYVNIDDFTLILVDDRVYLQEIYQS